MLKALDAKYQPMVDALVNVADREDYQVRPQYSGRAMMGEKCLAVVHHRASEWEIAMEVMTEILETVTTPEELGAAVEAMAGLRSKADSMGRDTVLYWEELKVEGDLPGGDDEEEDC